MLVPFAWLSAAFAPTWAAVEPAPPSRAPMRPYAAFVAEAAQRFGVPEPWIWAVMRAESRGDPRAVSSAGARGLMQIMPKTWTELAARYRLGPDPFDVHANILGGTAYLRELVDRYGDLSIALAAYNAGPGRVDAWRSSARPLPIATPVYVAKIATALGVANSLDSVPTLVARPPDWRSATLFVVRGGSVPATAPAASNTPPLIGSSAPTQPVIPQPIAAANPLFVPSSGRIAP